MRVFSKIYKNHQVTVIVKSPPYEDEKYSRLVVLRTRRPEVLLLISMVSLFIKKSIDFFFVSEFLCTFAESHERLSQASLMQRPEGIGMHIYGKAFTRRFVLGCSELRKLQSPPTDKANCRCVGYVILYPVIYLYSYRII